jgi:hypothetical protein
MPHCQSIERQFTAKAVGHGLNTVEANISCGFDRTFEPTRASIRTAEDRSCYCWTRSTCPGKGRSGSATWLRFAS